MADFFIRAGNRLPAFEATLLRDGVVADLTGAVSVQLIYRPEAGGGAVVRTAQVIGDPILGKVRYAWVADDTALVGIFLMYIEVTWAGGVTESFPNRSHNKFAVTSIFG